MQVFLCSFAGHSIKHIQNSVNMVRPTASDAAEQRANNYELKYKGVRKRKWGKYVSEVRLPNSRERIWLGSYDTAEKAARAFDAAIFCLRGPNAKFNFPDEPLNIAGWEALPPAEIQAVAQHYGNTYGTSSSHQPQPPPESGLGPRAVELDDVSPSLNSEGAGLMESIDWSFLDVLDSDTAGNASHLLDFGLFHEPVDMYMPHLDDDDDNDDIGNGGNVPSYLWNF